MSEKVLRYYAQAGINMPQCPVRAKNGYRCDGIHSPVQISLDELAKIRHGQSKSVTANFSCKHGWQKAIFYR